MKKINIEKSIKRAVEQAPALDFEKLANTPVVKMSEHDYITRQQEEQSPKRLGKLIVGFAGCFIALICFSGWFVQYKMPDSVIALDVNPSIELVTNKQNHILSVKALNEDAKEVIDGKDYKNDDLGSTVDALLDSMISQGYLSIDKNIIMVSVENKDIKKAYNLTALLDEVIRDSVSSEEISPHILRQVFTKDKAASALAEKYSVSVGKIKLMNEILYSCNKFSMDELSRMTIRDLILIANENAIDLNKTIQFDDDYFNSDENNKGSLPSDTGNNGGDADSPSENVNNDNDSSSSRDTGNNGSDADSSSENDNNNNASVSSPDTGNNGSDATSPQDNSSADDSSPSPSEAKNVNE